MADEGQDNVDWYKQRLGQQGNEIGELRRELAELRSVADKYIQSNDPPPSFDDDPVKAVERLVETKIKPIQDHLSQQSAQSARQKLEQAHPDFEQVVQDPQFQEWVKGSRMNSAAFEAAVSGDIDTGIDLIAAYKQNHQPSRSALDTALASNAGGSREMGGRESTVYKRAEIIRKRIEDPEWYRINQADIMRAYKEGRVR